MTTEHKAYFLNRAESGQHAGMYRTAVILDLFEMIEVRDKKLEKILSLVNEGEQAMLGTNGNPPIPKKLIAEWFDKFHRAIDGGSGERFSE